MASDESDTGWRRLARTAVCVAFALLFGRSLVVGVVTGVMPLYGRDGSYSELVYAESPGGFVAFVLFLVGALTWIAYDLWRAWRR